MTKHVPFDYGNVTHYVAAAWAIPMLSKEEEQMLARRWREHEDPQAAQQIVASHLRLAISMARGFRGYGIPIGDLIQAANMGLLKAIKRFEPERGFQFATYAQWWMRAAIQEHVMATLSIVKMSTMSNFKKAFFNLRKAKRHLGIDYDGDLRPEDLDKIARRLKIPKSTVIDADRRLQSDRSLNEKVSANRRRETETLEWVDILEDDTALDQETILIETEEVDNRLNAMRNALDVLNGRERRIFMARRLTDPPLTLEVLGNELGISRERVRQIEVRAFKKVQKRTYDLYRNRTTGFQERELAVA